MPLYPSLYQINARIFLSELSARIGRPATLDDIPDAALDDIAALGFDWIWLLGVWQTGPAGRQVSLTQPQWREEYRKALPDFRDEDVCGSPFAIRRYTLHAEFGGSRSLSRLRKRLQKRDLRLLLDFVPNHTALDHAWVIRHPEYYVHGAEEDVVREPGNFWLKKSARKSSVFARGRDPYFPAWPDTLQLNYRHGGLRKAMTSELIKLARVCDGLRCDMAMLILPDIFQRTWAQASLPADGTAPVDAPFWPEAIAAVRGKRADFLFMAEVYWDLEWTLQQQGFDYTYDKRLYDCLVAGNARTVRDHLGAEPEYQRKLTRFLENHDEARIAASLPEGPHEAAAVIAYFVPGLRFFHEGQLDGRRIKTSLHLRRRTGETANSAIREFYLRLLECLKRPEVRGGSWQLLHCRPAWEGNPTWDNFIAFAWEGTLRSRILITVNFGATQGQCLVAIPFQGLEGSKYTLRDLLSPARYEWNGDDLLKGGLFLDMPAWGYHVFEMQRHEYRP